TAILQTLFKKRTFTDRATAEKKLQILIDSKKLHRYSNNISWHSTIAFGHGFVTHSTSQLCISESLLTYEYSQSVQTKERNFRQRELNAQLNHI
uniref:Uncharacterized protein n=1 Tax=Romanomermis culicivorax TaxID=13658 RepID=A0A915JUT2_ROMCU